MARLKEDRSFAFVERLGIPDLNRAEKIGSGKVLALCSRIEQAQLVRHVAAKPELI
jgi:hypothetical protein